VGEIEKKGWGGGGGGGGDEECQFASEFPKTGNERQCIPKKEE